MIKEIIHIGGKRCHVFADEVPKVLLIEPMDERDLEFLDREIETLKAGTDRPFALATLIIEDWNHELTPWAAEPVFGKDPFGNGVPATLGLTVGPGDKAVRTVGTIWPFDGRPIRQSL